MNRILLRAAALAMLSSASMASAWAEGTLTLTVPAMPTGYPITASAGLSDILAINVIGEGLTRWTKDKLEVEPSLATSWETNADATVWTFNLREGVKWHDGAPFTADDVKFTFDLILNKNVRAATLGQVATLTSVEVVSPTQVRMTFSQPNSSLPVMLAYRMPIVPKHALESQDPNQPVEFIKKPIGTGAFMFAKAASGQAWSTVRNPNWWGGKVDLDGVDFRIMPDANSVVAELKTANVDVGLVQPQQIATLKGSGGVEISAVEQPSIYYVSLLNNKAPFEDVRVRKALNYAVDKQGIIKAVVNGYATPASSMIAPSVDGYTADVTQYPYDPAKAKALLAEAGWVESNGKLMKNGQQMKVSIATSTGVIGGPQLAQIIQQQLADIGIEASINMVDFRQLWTGVFDGTFQTSVEYLNLQPSADIINALGCGGSQNRFAYCDPELDAMFKTASALTDPAARKAEYAKIQKRISENPPGIWLYYPQEIRAIGERVKGFPKNPLRMATTRLFDVKVQD
ncbi:Oligopeptide-binding protein AppA [Hyphomicrobiales bacterium]|nr:Oligopeptide-binding protein AppA [Hyphomicrobiales bacterium]CAH1693319.1 Oligopeptide-binding protein AppA [Hyphomicrobiales bacterium]